MTVDQVPWAGLAAAGLLLLAAGVLGMRRTLGRAWDRGYGAGWNDGWDAAEAEPERLEPLPLPVFQPPTIGVPGANQTLALPAARPPPESAATEMLATHVFP